MSFAGHPLLLGSELLGEPRPTVAVHHLWRNYSAGTSISVAEKSPDKIEWIDD